jgi:hypothetical protein
VFQATCLAQISGYLGWVLPANTLLLINASLGGSPNIIWVAVAWTLGFSIGLALVGRLRSVGKLAVHSSCVLTVLVVISSVGDGSFFGSSALAVVGNALGASAQSINMVWPIQTLDLMPS